jgi:hypothetical protein
VGKMENFNINYKCKKILFFFHVRDEEKNGRENPLRRKSIKFSVVVVFYPADFSSVVYLFFKKKEKKEKKLKIGRRSSMKNKNKNSF